MSELSSGWGAAALPGGAVPSIMTGMKVRGWLWGRRALALGALALVAGCSGKPLTGPVDPRPPAPLGRPILVDAEVLPTCASACCSFVSPNCPATVPAPGTPCEQPSPLACEYGDDPVSACNTVVKCVAGSWTLQQSPMQPVAGCPTAEPICPSSFANARNSGVDCGDSALNLNCVYPEGVCVCDGGWDCILLPNDCPATRPRAGTPCDPDGGQCQRWGDSCTADGMSCDCGIWVPSVCIGLEG